jgi:hypothetical protein
MVAPHAMEHEAGGMETQNEDSLIFFLVQYTRNKEYYDILIKKGDISLS